jgi:hypothetical protein
MSIHSKKESSKDLSERLFFHDIINLTHGLLLFLSHKKAIARGIESHEIPALEKEIKTLQLMLKDHYRLKHKNLNDCSEWLPLKEIKPALTGLLETYLGQKHIAYTIAYKHENEAQLVYLPVFYRIMNNIIKNMSEAKVHEAQIELIFENGSLLIETKNTISGPSTRSLEGLGLESIRLLAFENGGRFSHEIVNQLWCNHIRLPLKEADIQIKNWQTKKTA